MAKHTEGVRITLQVISSNKVVITTLKVSAPRQRAKNTQRGSELHSKSFALA